MPSRITQQRRYGSQNSPTYCFKPVETHPGPGKENLQTNTPSAMSYASVNNHSRTSHWCSDVDGQQSPFESNTSSANARLSFTEQRLRTALVEKQQLLEEVSRCKKRERQLLSEHKRAARQIEELKAHATRTDEVCKEMMGARRSAREALSDMAQQNSRLITALLDKKTQIQQLQQEHTQAVAAAQEEVLLLRRKVDDATAAAALAQTQLQALTLAPQALQSDAACQAECSTSTMLSSDTQTETVLLESWVNDRIHAAVQVAVQDAVQEAIQHAQLMWEEERHCLTHEIMQLKGQLDAVQQQALEHGPEISTDDDQLHAAPSCDPTDHAVSSVTPTASSHGNRDHAAAAPPAAAESAGFVHAPTSSSSSSPGQFSVGEQYRPCSDSDSLTGVPGVQSTPDVAGNVQLQATAAEQSPLSEPHLNSNMARGLVDVAGLQQQVAALQQDREQLLQKLEQYRQIAESAEAQHKAIAIREQAEAHKQAGNNAFHQQQYQAAIAHYDRALALKLLDKHLNAVLHCNKAAALHEQGLYVDAVVECCMAEACDPEYSRVFQRRSEAYQALGDYAAALQDMEKVAKTVRSADMERKLAQLERRARQQGPLNYYAVLNVSSHASAADIKAAYRAMALRYHPDKISNPVLEPACATVFKLAAEAHATLADVDRRAAYDALQLRRRLAKFR